MLFYPLVIFIIHMSFDKIVAALFLLVLTLSSTYKTKLASQLTYISAISYESQTAISSWKCNLCSHVKVLHPKVVSNGGVFGFTGYSPDIGRIVIAFRGSDDIFDWILNLDIARISYPLCSGCSVHQGFSLGFNSVKSQVQANINSLQAIYQNTKIALTGHSFGGALAVMAAAHIHHVYKNVDQLYTMGQPRVGNDKFARFMTSFIQNTFRVIHYADQVPHIPQNFLGFKHSGFQIWYYRGMQRYTVCQSESNGCSNQLNIFELTPADHKMTEYLHLKVQNYVKELIQSLNFKRLAFKNRGKVFDLDQEAKLAEEKQVKEANKKIQKQLSTIKQ